MNRLVRDLLIDLNRKRRNSDFVFVSPKTDGLLTDIKHAFVAACNEAEVGDFHFHDLRTQQRRGWPTLVPIRLLSRRYLGIQTCE